MLLNAREGGPVPAWLLGALAATHTEGSVGEN